ncbi:MAG: DUF4491 family protein [Tannerellaceae bacterium]|nr:DUF4491 family protein [Tannerellaceae bacterium]
MMTGLYCEGLLTGLTTFVIIGLFHPLVIKAEYYVGVRCWWAFLFAGLLAAGGSLYVANTFFSSALGVFAFSSFWGIKELFEQEKRVARGWFPANPKRKRRKEA